VFTTSYTQGNLSTAPTCLINGGGAKDPNTPHVLPPPAS